MSKTITIKILFNGNNESISIVYDEKNKLVINSNNENWNSKEINKFLVGMILNNYISDNDEIKLELSSMQENVKNSKYEYIYDLFKIFVDEYNKSFSSNETKK